MTHSEDDTYPEVIYDRKQTLNAFINPTNRTQLGRTFKEIKKIWNNMCDILESGKYQ